MLYFVRKSETLVRMQALCDDIIANYKSIVFKGFNDRLADEPVYALAMAVLDLHPVDRKPEYYCFVPYATKLRSNYSRRAVRFANPTDGEVNSCCVVHWGNRNTEKAQYRFDVGAINAKSQGGVMYSVLYKMSFLLCIYKIVDFILEFCDKVSWFFDRVIHKLKK